jgi:hypothetical protein
MNLQTQAIAALFGPHVQIVRFRGGDPVDAVYVDGGEVARLREEALPEGGSFVVAIDLQDREVRAFVGSYAGYESDWHAAADWLLRRLHCNDDQIAQAIAAHDAAEREHEEGMYCDARR